jgi:hypothetical protein
VPDFDYSDVEGVERWYEEFNVLYVQMCARVDECSTRGAANKNMRGGDVDLDPEAARDL